MKKISKYKLYLKTLIKYYLKKQTKSSAVFVLSLFVFIWICLISREIMSSEVFSAERSGLVRLGDAGLGLLILYIKPIFVFVAGLLIIKSLKKDQYE